MTLEILVKGVLKNSPKRVLENMQERSFGKFEKGVL
jgi:hypothetical protein